MVLSVLVATTAAAQTRVPTTFDKDIAPILWSQCAACHRPGQIGPFSLITFEEVRPRAREILNAVRRRSMPPWTPEPGYGEFVGARRLTSEQLGAFQRWADDGFQRGNDADLPTVPEWSHGWQLGKPDLIVSMPEPYALKSAGSDVFRTFVLPIPGATRRHVRALEFNPGSFAAVHHANIKIDRTRASRRLDAEEIEPGYEGGGSRDAQFPDGNFLGWTPGQSPREAPEEMAWGLDPDSDLVVETHMMPTGKPENVQISVGLYFSDKPPTHLPYTLRLGRQDIDIRPGNQAYVNEDSFALPVDVDVLAVQPHAHLLAKEVRAFATLPDGTTKWLIFIKDWNFHWQDVYRYSTPLFLPKGTTVTMRYTYDNSARNLRNPNRPARRVTYGQTTASEMGNLWVQVLPRSSDDWQLLNKTFLPKLLQDDTAGYEKMLDVDAHDARLHTALAHAYVEAGRITDALRHFDEALRLDPNAFRHYDLGTVQLQRQRFPEAADHFAEAIRLRPDFAEALYGLGVARQQEGKLDDAVGAYRRALQFNRRFADAYFNLGRALVAQGRPAEAIEAYAQEIALTPDDAEAHRSLAAVLASEHRVDEAIDHFRTALRLVPDLPGALVDLAWILATSDRADIRNPAEAVGLAERVASLTNHQNAGVLDALAAAYAAAGRIDQAIATAQAAVRLAAESGDLNLAARIQQRLDFYAQRKP